MSFGYLYGIWFVSGIVFFAIVVLTYIVIKKAANRPVFLGFRGSNDFLTSQTNHAVVETAMNVFFKKNARKDFSLISIDITAFHYFNTVFGNAAGDKLLGVIGNCIKEKYNCGVRIYADVFLFVAPTEPNLIAIAKENLYMAIRQNFGEQFVHIIGFKFGVFPLFDDVRSFREAYDGALLALRTVKASAQQDYMVYDRKMQQLSKLGRDIEVNMKQALKNGEFEMFIQPKFSVASGRCCGGEALIRWNSQNLGFLFPGHFVPLFEQNGFIIDVDLYMLEKLLSYMQKLIDGGKTPLPISLNQSRITVSFPNYMERMEALVKSYSVPLDLIEIEITESAVIGNDDELVAIVHRFRSMGFSVAIDDFGSGLSSLNTLKDLEVSTLKLDKHFLQTSDETAKGKKIIQSIISMSRDLDIITVCEGVETGAQFDFLKSTGCDIIQGYLFSKPLPYTEYLKNYINTFSISEIS